MVCQRISCALIAHHVRNQDQKSRVKTHGDRVLSRTIRRPVKRKRAKVKSVKVARVRKSVPQLRLKKVRIKSWAISNNGLPVYMQCVQRLSLVVSVLMKSFTTRHAKTVV